MLSLLNYSVKTDRQIKTGTENNKTFGDWKSARWLNVLRPGQFTIVTLQAQLGHGPALCATHSAHLLTAIRPSPDQTNNGLVLEVSVQMWISAHR
jgi:hypothetical protein